MIRKRTGKSSATPPAAPPDETVYGEDGAPETPAAGLTDAEKALLDELKAKEKEPAERAEAAPSVEFAPAAEPEPEHAPEEPQRINERRGRPKGSKGKRKNEEREAKTPENLTKLLLSCHQMLAALAGIPELLLTQDEAAQMGAAIHDVEVLYADSILSPEITAWSNLALTSVMVYWPRYVAIKRRVEKEAKESIDVTPINRAPNGSGVAPNMSREGTGTVS